MAIFVLVMFLYNILFKGEAVPVESELSATTIAEDLQETYKELEAITFDRAPLSLPGYLLLTDFSVEIVPQPVGRSNPFGTI